MKTSRILLVGGLAFLVLGGAVLAAASSPDAVPVGSLQIGEAHLGDEVHYVFKGVLTEVTAEFPIPNETVFEHGFRIASLERSHDRTGAAHPTVKVETWDFDPWYGNKGKVASLFIHLATRDFIQVRGHYGDAGSWSTSQISAGPWIPRWDTTPFRYQGHTIREGQDLGSFHSRSLADLQARDYVERWAIRAEAGRMFTLNGSNAILVQISEEARWKFSPTLVVETSRKIEEWWVEGQPYPLRTDFAGFTLAEPDDGPAEKWTFNSTALLARFKRGETPVAWLPAPATNPYREANPTVERSAGLRPADGAHSRLRLGLDPTIQRVETDPALLRFHAWRQLHPDALLIGGQLIGGLEQAFGGPAPTGTKEVPHDTWTLIYGSPSAQSSMIPAFILSAKRDRGTGLLSVVERGEAQLPETSRYRADHLPRTPVTLDAVDRIWQRMVGGNLTQEPPNYVHWGYYARDSRPNLFYPTSLPPRLGQWAAGREAWWQHVTLGRWDERLPEPDVLNGGLRFEGLRSVVLANLTTGNVGLALTFDFGETYSPAPLAALWPDLHERMSIIRPGPAIPATSGVGAIALASASFAVALALFAAVAWQWVKWAGGSAAAALPGYAKISSDQVLESPRREEIMRMIRGEPGITPPEVHARVGGGWSTIVYHLGVLERNQLVSSLVDGRHKRFFPVGVIDHGARGQVAALRNDRTRQIFEFLSRHPDSNQRAVAVAAGITPASALWHLRRLEAAGLIQARRDGRNMAYRANLTSVPVARAVEATAVGA